MLFNVDFHGTLVSSEHDRWIKEQMLQNPSKADNSSLWSDYGRMVYNTRDIVTLNTSLLTLLSTLKEQGHAIRLWTNANDSVARDVKYILRDYSSLFDSFVFCNGKKRNQRVEGVVIDNEQQNLICGERSILVPTFK
jgi:hypothetical protein